MYEETKSIAGNINQSLISDDWRRANSMNWRYQPSHLLSIGISLPWTFPSRARLSR